MSGQLVKAPSTRDIKAAEVGELPYTLGVLANPKSPTLASSFGTKLHLPGSKCSQSRPHARLFPSHDAQPALRKRQPTDSALVGRAAGAGHAGIVWLRQPASRLPRNTRTSGTAAVFNASQPLGQLVATL